MQIMSDISCTHLSIPNSVSTEQDRVLSKRKVSSLRLPRRRILTDVEMRSPLAVVQRTESKEDPTEDQSPPVLCVLQRDARDRGWRRLRRKRGNRLYVGMAMHDKLACLFNF